MTPNMCVSLLMNIQGIKKERKKEREGRARKRRKEKEYT
jgi:hypothetical protein